MRELVANGHSVIVETSAGSGIGAGDDDYRRTGAEVAATASDVFEKAEMIVKVKEPQAVERAITADVYSVLGVENSVASRRSFGGTAPENVRRAAAAFRVRLKGST